MTTSEKPIPAALFIHVYGERDLEAERLVREYERRAAAARRWHDACFGD